MISDIMIFLNTCNCREDEQTSES